MFAIFGSLIGFISSIAPNVLDFFKDKQDKKHELELMDKQLEFQRLKGDIRQQEIIAEQDTVQYSQMYNYATVTKIDWVEALACTVRPILTYAFFVLYALVKFSVFVFFLDKGHEWTDIIANHLWSEEDETIFSAVISFWFGNRAFRK